VKQQRRLSGRQSEAAYIRGDNDSKQLFSGRFVIVILGKLLSSQILLGTLFYEIMHRRCYSAISAEDVDFLSGTDNLQNFSR
jgi:hypothetical protein